MSLAQSQTESGRVTCGEAVCVALLLEAIPAVAVVGALSVNTAVAAGTVGLGTLVHI